MNKNTRFIANLDVGIHGMSVEVEGPGRHLVQRDMLYASLPGWLESLCDDVSKLESGQKYQIGGFAAYNGEPYRICYILKQNDYDNVEGVKV